MTNATTATEPESLDVTSELMRSRQRADEKSCDSSTTTEPSKPARLPTTTSITPGSEASWLTLGRRAWRAGRDEGQKQGAARYFTSPVMEQMSLELTVQRVVIDAMSAAAEQREKALAHWKSEAAWWKAEHDKVHDEYCAFVEEMRRKYVR